MFRVPICPCHTPTIQFDGNITGHIGALVIHRPSNSTAISPDTWGVQNAVLEDGKMAATYTAQQRAEILRLAQEVGPLEAAKRKGVPPGTVTAWRCLENKRAKLAKRVITNPTGAPNPIRKGPLQELLETKGSISTIPPT